MAEDCALVSNETMARKQQWDRRVPLTARRFRRSKTTWLINHDVPQEARSCSATPPHVTAAAWPTPPSVNRNANKINNRSEPVDIFGGVAKRWRGRNITFRAKMALHNGYCGPPL